MFDMTTEREGLKPASDQVNRINLVGDKYHLDAPPGHWNAIFKLRATSFQNRAHREQVVLDVSSCQATTMRLYGDYLISHFML
ncbi:hypothetical protein PARHAE_04055 [Paracoccus haematequi]|uniref:Uncharacterized protein n=1 Tax=Paracoccus haematequi TaxID=2491866 RepID=A0A3S4DEW4_9RHOB|nr:hypothetical protein PARHAE_04055 [Paracoccus haematequi]